MTLAGYARLIIDKKDEEIEKLEQENNKLLDVINNQDVKIADLEKKLEQTEKDLADYQFNYPTIKELEKENKRLEEQIEKMKCCQNCKNYTWNMSNKKCQFRCESREACDNWKLKEIKEND